MNNELNNINHNKQQPEILLLQQQGFIDAQNVNDKLLNNAAAAPSPWWQHSIAMFAPDLPATNY